MRENLSERNSHPLRAGRQRRLVDYGRAVDYGQNGEREFRDRLHSGLETENPYLHLREFEEVCNTYSDTNCSMNTIRLKLFPFSLKDKAKTWLQNLRSGSIRSWDEIQEQFLKKILSPS